MKEDFRLKATDIIPIYGVCNYIWRNRNRNERYNVGQLVKYIKTETALTITNIAFATTTLIGLEKILS